MSTHLVFLRLPVIFTPIQTQANLWEYMPRPIEFSKQLSLVCAEGPLSLLILLRTLTNMSQVTQG